MRFVLCALGLLVMSCASEPLVGCVVNRDCSPNETCVNGFCQRIADGGAQADVAAPLDAAAAPDSGLCGDACDTGMPCEVGAYDCSSGTPVCMVIGVNQAEMVCRESHGDCDVAEVCDGVNPACPSDALLAASDVCREAEGVCDAPESCTGSSPVCPIDQPQLAGSPCGGGFCDGTGMCVTTCTPGGTCSTGNPCEQGVIACEGGMPVCQVASVLANGESCGRGTVGPWSSCGGFTDECDETGFESRSVTMPVCSSGSCVDNGRSMTRPCERETDGLACDGGNTSQCHTCGAGSCTAWVSCAPPTTCCAVTNMCGCRDER